MVENLGTATERDEKSAFIEDLSNLLSDHQLEFSGENAFDLATAMANHQVRRWQQLLGPFRESDRPDSFIAKHLRVFISFIEPAIQTARVRRLGDRSVVSSEIPILRQDISSELIVQIGKYPLLAALLVAQHSKRVIHRVDNAHILPWLLAGYAVDVAQRHDKRDRSISERLEQKIELERSQTLGLLEDLETKTIAAIHERHSSLLKKEEEFNELLVVLKKEQTEWPTQRDTAIQAIRTEVKEFVKIETSINLWQTKARWHTFNYLTLGILFGAALISTALFLINGGASSFISQLTAIPSDHQFLGVALLAIPTLAIAWLLRFIARLALQNLSLAHDARQRHAQVNTYLRLLGDISKPISEKERILALAALFRPLPGQGPDDVNPPTIADLLKEAQDKITAPRS